MRNQIQDEDDEYPNNVNEVPIERNHLVRPKGRGQRTIPWKKSYVGEEHQSDDDVGRVKGRQSVKDRSVGIAVGRERFPVIQVFKALQNHKHQPNANGQNESDSCSSISLAANLPLPHSSTALLLSNTTSMTSAYISLGG